MVRKLVNKHRKMPEQKKTKRLDTTFGKRRKPKNKKRHPKRTPRGGRGRQKNQGGVKWARREQAGGKKKEDRQGTEIRKRFPRAPRLDTLGKNQKKPF